MGSYSFYQEPPRSDELYHHGIKGQKWGVRRFQQANGTLTSAGKKRYLNSDGGVKKVSAKQKYRTDLKNAKSTMRKSKGAALDEYDSRILKLEKNYKKGDKLSDADYAKERKIGSDFNKKWDAAKQQYKQDKANIKTAYKQGKVQAKFDKRLSRLEAVDQKLLDQRAKNRQAKLDKFDQQVEKGKLSKGLADARKKAFAKDFDAGTRSIKAGQKRYNDVIRNYGKQKVASIADRNVKKSEGYKQAKRIFDKQNSNRKWSGSRSAVVLSYAVQDAVERIETKK